MKSWEIIDETLARGEAEKLSKLTGLSPELYNSYRRAPRSVENPLGTGNRNPVQGYFDFFVLRFAKNPDGAIRMHLHVEAEIRQQIAEEMGGGDVCALSIENVERALEVVKALKSEDVRKMGRAELKRVYSLLIALDAGVEYARSILRAEMKRFDAVPEAEFGRV